MSVHGIGVDVLNVERMAEIVARRGDAFLRRVFTPDEIAYCLRHKNPAPSLSARFSAKEAVIKALGVGWQPGMRWTDMEVLRAPNGKPSLMLHGATGEIARRMGIERTHLSLTHESDRAMAFVVLEG
ncbi:MAG TPA: holo-ACP synthase [Stenomitos sp.]